MPVGCICDLEVLGGREGYQCGCAYGHVIWRYICVV